MSMSRLKWPNIVQIRAYLLPSWLSIGLSVSSIEVWHSRLFLQFAIRACWSSVSCHVTKTVCSTAGRYNRTLRQKTHNVTVPGLFSVWVTVTGGHSDDKRCTDKGHKSWPLDSAVRYCCATHYDSFNGTTLARCREYLCSIDGAESAHNNHIIMFFFLMEWSGVHQLYSSY